KMRKLPEEKSRIKQPRLRCQASLRRRPAHQDWSSSGERTDQRAEMSAAFEWSVKKEVAQQCCHSDETGQSICSQRKVKCACDRQSNTKVKRFSWCYSSGGERTISSAAHLGVVEPLEILIECGCTASNEPCTKKSVK